MTEEKREKLDLEEALTDLVSVRRRIAKDVEIGYEVLEEIKHEEKIRIRAIRISSVAAILVLSIWVFGPSLLSLDPVGSYNSYYSRMSTEILTRGGETDGILKKAVEAYENGEPEKTKQLLNNQNLEEVASQESVFFLALANLDLGHLTEAKSGLDELLETGILAQPEIYWYSALISLHEGDFNDIRTLLRQLKSLDPGFKRKEVRKLLRRVRFR